MARARKDKGKGKGPPAGTVDNLHKRIESEQISTDIAAFEKTGGRVEKLGATRVLQKIDADTASAPAPAPAPAAQASGRPRKR